MALRRSHHTEDRDSKIVEYSPVLLSYGTKASNVDYQASSIPFNKHTNLACYRGSTLAFCSIADNHCLTCCTIRVPDESAALTL